MVRLQPEMMIWPAVHNAHAARGQPSTTESMMIGLDVEVENKGLVRAVDLHAVDSRRAGKLLDCVMWIMLPEPAGYVELKIFSLPLKMTLPPF